MWAVTWFSRSSTFSFTQQIQVPLEREALAVVYGAVKHLSHESTSEHSPFFTATTKSQGSLSGAGLGKHTPFLHFTKIFWAKLQMAEGV